MTLEQTARAWPTGAPRSWREWLRAAFEQRGASYPSLGLLVLVGVLGAFQIGPNELWVMLLLGIVGYEFQKRIDQGLPLMQMAALLAVLQWTVGAMFAYRSSISFGRYMMYVGEATYFTYVLPGTAAFVFGLLAIGSSVRQRALLQVVPRDDFVAIGLVLNAIAFLARVLAPRFPGSLAFLLFLLSQVGYVGVLYFLFSRSPLRWFLVMLGLYPLIRTSAEAAMFHDLLLWTSLLFFYWYGMRRRTAASKTLLLATVVVFIFTIQAIKPGYRAKVWSGQDASLLDEASDFWSNREAITSQGVVASEIVRLNQGWIISAVLRNVPAHEPYAGGETIVAAVKAALFPRFLAPDKVQAGGQPGFRRFTGLPLASSTSMAVSPLGEAYANFGRVGGILAMLVFGLALAGIYALCLQRVTRAPDFLLWVPLIFYQAIKAETEFATVFNQLVKGAIVAFGLHWLLRTRIMPALLSLRPGQAYRDAGRLADQPTVERPAG